MHGHGPRDPGLAIYLCVGPAGGRGLAGGHLRLRRFEAGVSGKLKAAPPSNPRYPVRPGKPCWLQSAVPSGRARYRPASNTSRQQPRGAPPHTADRASQIGARVAPHLKSRTGQLCSYPPAPSPAIGREAPAKVCPGARRRSAEILASRLAETAERSALARRQRSAEQMPWKVHLRRARSRVGLKAEAP